jgi:hypothetical protein
MRDQTLFPGDGQLRPLAVVAGFSGAQYMAGQRQNAVRQGDQSGVLFPRDLVTMRQNFPF